MEFENSLLDRTYVHGAETSPRHVSEWDKQLEQLAKDNAEAMRSTRAVYVYVPDPDDVAAGVAEPRNIEYVAYVSGWPKWKWMETKRNDPETGRDYVTRLIYAIAPNPEDVIAGVPPRMKEIPTTVEVPVNDAGEVVFLREDATVTRTFRQQMVDDLERSNEKAKLRNMTHKLSQKSKFTSKFDKDIAKRGADEATAEEVELMMSVAR